MPNYEEMGILKHLPLSGCDQAAGYETVTAYQNMIQHVDSPGKPMKYHHEYIPAIKTPAFISGGWFDPFKDETIESFQLLKYSATAEKVRRFTRLYIGPWEHAGLVNPDLFGEEGSQDDLNVREARFLQGLLENPDMDPLPEMPAVRYYMLGENSWRNADDWPPQETRDMKMYLHSGGNANSVYGDGILNATPPKTESPDIYISNPADPVVSCGGICATLGCYDRSTDEKRPDVLVYTTLPSDVPLTFAGQVKFHFSASASTPDTDYCAILTMVTPDKRSLFLTAGQIRARFRNDMEHAELIIPGKIYEYNIDLSHIAVKILPGYALRLELCGQYFPFWGRNSNTGNPLKDDTELQISRHTIFHDAKHPAYLELPVLIRD